MHSYLPILVREVAILTELLLILIREVANLKQLTAQTI